MTTERIDVLATLFAAIAVLDSHQCHISSEAIREVRSAVAELIERVEYLCRTGEGMIALRAALARVSGGAA